MDGLLDYILWQKDCAFAAVPFQEVDAVVLCLMAYCDFAPLFEHAEAVTLRDCQRLIHAGEVHIQSIGKIEPFLRILEAAADSRRFGELRMSGYVDIMLPEDPIQFSAVTFHSDAGWSFLAYRGTDNTLAGWKEDFMISFTRTQAQDLARQYADNRIDPGGTWYMGGHSKGGNLALYAACTLPQAKLSAVDRVFLLDGPGFCPEVVDPAAISRVGSRVTRVIPGFSVIGSLFDPRIQDTRIVRSSASGLLQHDPATWGVDHGRLALLPQTESASDIINLALARWIGDMTREDRKVFVNDIFDALGAGGAKTLEELGRQGRKGIEAMSVRIMRSSEITKRILKDLSRQAIQAILEALFHRQD